MSYWVLNMPLAIIGNISVQRFPLLNKCICFWLVEKMFSEATFKKFSTKYVLVKIIEGNIAFRVICTK